MSTDPNAPKLVKLIMALRRDGIHDTRVLAAMERVPREKFAPQSYKHLAYENQSLPLGLGQTLSQPFVVAKMSQELALKPNSRVLEVGTGSGYQAAILAHLSQRVTSIERIPELHHSARARLLSLEIYNTDLHLGDGFLGWPSGAPYDGIILTCAPDSVPQELFAQLAIGGRLVAPVGNQNDRQSLKVYTRKSETKLSAKTLGLVQFVPMLGGLSS
ncbi:MAG: protein-L-isoaspartate(D-aspartate) O-methyltransferase [Alphaproteobacteria bacterium]